MKFSIALFGHHGSPQLHVGLLGEKETEAGARACVEGSGSGEYLAGFAEFDCSDRILHAIGCSAGDDGPGSELEKFATFCVELGRKMGEKA